MGNLSPTFLPPQNWQEFEKFMRGVIDVIWEQKGWQNYGRSGQDQTGIDLFGYDNRNEFTGIQCKKKNITDSDGQLLTHSLLTEALLNKEIALAEKIINPSLDRLIFATTSSRDKKIQDIVRKINENRIKKGTFEIDIWFWEDLQVFIEQHVELRNWYFSETLANINIYDKDIHILTILRQAFTRPAFQREIRREESGADFIQAIKNTQEAITTGKLYNRRGDVIATSYDYKKISNAKWQAIIWKIYNILNKIRDEYQIGITKNLIKEHPTVIEIFDNDLANKFNSLRRECLKRINGVFIEAKLEPIDSELLR